MLGGGEWALQERPNNANNRTGVIAVKLTDAAIAAIEECVRNRTYLQCAPTIRFPSAEEPNGHLSIPIGSHGESHGFSFSISSTDDVASSGPQGSLECIASQGNRTLRSLGPMAEKLQVHASDDTYTRFGQKMFEARKESEKRTTQFIERVSNASSGRVVRRLPNAPHRNNGNNSNGNNTNGNNNMLRSREASAIRNPSRTSITKPMPTTTTSQRFNMNNKPPTLQPQQLLNPELARRPLRERIVHLLAVRPYKKPELLTRIVRDGLLDKDRRNISPLLKQVSAMKDNTYHLLRHIWNDVSEDWPFYSEQERQAFRRRKPQNLTPPCSDGSTSSCGRSPSSSTAFQPPPPPQTATPVAAPPSTASTMAAAAASPPSSASRKRRMPPQESSADSPTSKRKHRVSKYVRPPDMLMASPSSGRSPGTAGAPPPPGSPPSSRPSSSSPPPPLSSSGSGSGSGSGMSGRFPVISNKDQRRMYKQEFNTDYARYRQLHACLASVARKFDDMDRRLKACDRGSAEWHALTSRIMRKYDESQRDEKYMNAKREFEHLHRKLGLIKRRVHDFDTSNRA